MHLRRTGTMKIIKFISKGARQNQGHKRHQNQQKPSQLPHRTKVLDDGMRRMNALLFLNLIYEVVQHTLNMQQKAEIRIFQR